MADPQLVAQMNQIAYVSISTGTVNAFGEIQTSTAATAIYCRLQNVRREYEKIDGTEVRSMNLLLIDAAEGFTPTFETRFWLPGTSQNTPSMARRPHVVHACVDEFGNVDHWEVSL